MKWEDGEFISSDCQATKWAKKKSISKNYWNSNGFAPCTVFCYLFLHNLECRWIHQSRRSAIRRGSRFANVFRFTGVLARDKSRGAWLPANQYRIPNSNSKLIKKLKIKKLFWINSPLTQWLTQLINTNFIFIINNPYPCHPYVIWNWKLFFKIQLQFTPALKSPAENSVPKNLWMCHWL